MTLEQTILRKIEQAFEGLGARGTTWSRSARSSTEKRRGSSTSSPSSQRPHHSGAHPRQPQGPRRARQDATAPRGRRQHPGSVHGRDHACVPTGSVGGHSPPPRAHPQGVLDRGGGRSLRRHENSPSRLPARHSSSSDGGFSFCPPPLTETSHFDRFDCPCFNQPRRRSLRWHSSESRFRASAPWSKAAKSYSTSSSAPHSSWRSGVTLRFRRAPRGQPRAHAQPSQGDAQAHEVLGSAARDHPGLPVRQRGHRLGLRPHARCARRRSRDRPGQAQPKVLPRRGRRPAPLRGAGDVSGDDRTRWNFTVIAGIDLAVEERIELFMQGEKRVRVHSRLLLAQMDATNAFPTTRRHRPTAPPSSSTRRRRRPSRARSTSGRTRRFPGE